MDINERVQEILDKLEESINYEDFTLVDEARKGVAICIGRIRK